MDKKIFIKPVVILVLLSFLTITFTYAIYKNRTYGTGSMSLATWNVSLNQQGIENHLTVIPDPDGTTASYTLNISGQAEVDIIYSIEIDDVPNGVSVAIDNGQFVQATNNKVVFTDYGTIANNDNNKNKTHTLTFKAASTATYATDEEINIDVIARQSLN